MLFSYCLLICERGQRAKQNHLTIIGRVSFPVKQIGIPRSGAVTGVSLGLKVRKESLQKENKVFRKPEDFITTESQPSQSGFLPSRKVLIVLISVCLPSAVFFT